MTNPFPYTLDNKRYQTWNYYTRARFGFKIAKVPLDAGFTCPNRDGTKGTGGCLFCPSDGADSFPVPAADQLLQQYQQRYALLQTKWPDAVAAPYFQAYSNTYAPVERLKQIYEPFVPLQPPMLVIATRSDCIDEEIYSYLVDLNKRVEVWIEFGIQSVFDRTLAPLHCQHPFAQAAYWLHRLSNAGIHTAAHLINGLPNETIDDMIESAKEIARCDIDALKIHTLLILKDAPLASLYQTHPFPLLSRDEYIDILIRQLEVLPSRIVLERVVSDAPEDQLIAPAWTRKKTIVLNELDKRMKQLDTWQGKYAETDSL